MSSQLNTSDYYLSCDPKPPRWWMADQRPFLPSGYWDDWDANNAIALYRELWWNEAKNNHVTRVLEDLTNRVMYAKPQRVEDAQTYTIPLIESFRVAAEEYPAIAVDPDVMVGAPCIAGTRIPVYMVLDAIEYYGELVAARRSYPQLTIQQIKDAIGFAKLVVECPIDNRLAITA